jgi:deoxyribodipyrimidine photolyase
VRALSISRGDGARARLSAWGRSLAAPGALSFALDQPTLFPSLFPIPSPLQVPVFIYAPEEEGQFQPGRCSRWWLRQSLAALGGDLAALGGRLVLRRGPASLPALRQLAAEAGATALVFNHLYDPISLVRDDEVKAGLAADGLWVQVR